MFLLIGEYKLTEYGKWSEIPVWIIPACDAKLLGDMEQNMLSISEQLFSPSRVGKVILGIKL